MKNSFCLPAIFCLSAVLLTAQDNIEYTQTDDDYANTTVVFKTGNADDLAVLDQLDADFGMGDVVRIRVAPPKTAASLVSPKPKTATDNLSARSMAIAVATSTVEPQNIAAATPPTVAPASVLKTVKTVPFAPRTKSVLVKRHTKSPRKSWILRLFSEEKYQQKGKQQYACYKF